MRIKETRRGDTMIEVMFGVAIFGLVAITTIGLMNNGLASSEANLESTMARNEMDAQTEALRLVHSAYSSTKTDYAELWKSITNLAVEDSSTSVASSIKSISDTDECSTFFNENGIAKKHGFVLNIVSLGLIEGKDLSSATTYPIVDDDPVKAKGIWINVIKSSTKDSSGTRPMYYDFYIRSCWYGAGKNTPSHLDTIIRLFNPEAT